MKTIEWKKIYGALALLVSVGVQAAEPPAIKITGEHLDYYIDSHLAPGGSGASGFSVSGDTLSFSGGSYTASDSESYGEIVHAPFYVTAHEGYTLAMSPEVSFAGAHSGMDAQSSSAGSGEMLLMTYVDAPSGVWIVKYAGWSSPSMQPGQTLGQSGGNFSSSNFGDNGVRSPTLAISMDMFLNADAYVSIGVDRILMTFNAVPLSVATPVPEPETYAMLLGGLALIGAIARGRRRA
jgi:hypothetical protein